MVSSLNEQLLNIIDNFILIKESVTDRISKDFMDKYSKIIKVHKVKKNKDVSNANNIFKNLDMVINNIKQFSNNFFKIGYFKPIHSICLDFFRVIETFPCVNLAGLIVNNVLFYILNLLNISQEKKLTNKQLVFSPSSFMGIGLGNNITPPFLPNVASDVFTLVLDLDETLVHFFFVIEYYNLLLDAFRRDFLNSTRLHGVLTSNEYHVRNRDLHCCYERCIINIYLIISMRIIF